MKTKLTLLTCCLLLMFFHSNAQDSLDYNYAKGWSFDISSMTLGMANFNPHFEQAGIETAPSSKLAFAFNSYHQKLGTPFYHGWQLIIQSHTVNENSLTAANYNVAKQYIGYYGGYEVFDNKLITVPLEVALGLGIKLLNVEFPRDNTGDDFDDILTNGGSSGSITNLGDFGIYTMLQTGLDIKTSLFSYKLCNHRRTTIGVRVGYIYQLTGPMEQQSAALEPVSGIPAFEKGELYMGVRFGYQLFQCKP